MWGFVDRNAIYVGKTFLHIGDWMFFVNRSRFEIDVMPPDTRFWTKKQLYKWRNNCAGQLKSISNTLKVIQVNRMFDELIS